ncbi:hypothetical protein P152DRAFT_393064 [Eremomyces bilateralis CBS 781.70]|uniref:Uncharacterized protein n=1 Tax=Eremomyces bilateralis CBS 781.70 TaxID=1392243 RepID=A0A6G1G8J3_9PEZI|nr:uncharacterized protein P152DRAFT_393064 [Eremomyces bilateralis CBS 781.70]KAF1814241.1 hypothetical protein P152DRAFT_393064 [Eremomyces bilateralis CBS 781.70]
MKRNAAKEEVKRPAEQSNPATTLNLYCRLFQGRKQLFSPADPPDGVAPASYFIINPIPHKHAWQWRPVLHRGDNPKYTADTLAIARMTRSAMWGSFCLWMGDGVDTIVKNKKRRRAKRKARRAEKWRKFWHMKPKPPKEPLQDEMEVVGKVCKIHVRRAGFWSRRVEWEFDGVRYQWSGTRTLSKNKLKGWTHDVKLIRKSDHALIATLKKDRWSTFRSSEKIGQPPNKKRAYVGQLCIYPAAYEQSTIPDQTKESTLAKHTAKIDGAVSGKKKNHHDDIEIPDGPHAGNMLEELIVLTAWIVIEAEHRLRWKIVDLIEEIGESAGG